MTSVLNESDPDHLVIGEAATTQWPGGVTSPSPLATETATQSQLPCPESASAGTSVPPGTAAGFDGKTGQGLPPVSSTTPSGSPSLNERSAQEPVHVGVACDFCGKADVRGTRYKCVQCANYDRCSACTTSPRAWAGHGSTHQFFPIRTKDDLAHFTQILSKDLPQSCGPSGIVVHTGITCDGCAKAIEGVRHKCLVCDDYDLCGVCISDPSKRQEHSPLHTFFTIITPQDRPLYDDARRTAQPQPQPQPQGAQHNRVCDLCGQFPLVGVRHRCLECPDYDLCTECVSNPEVRMKHDLTHVFYPIPTAKHGA